MTTAGSASPSFGSGRAATGLYETLTGALHDPTASEQAGLLLLDLQGLITHINAKAASTLRCSLTDAVGLDFWDVVSAQIAEQHFAATKSALASQLQHYFVAHDEFEGSWTAFTFISHPSGCTISLRDVGRTRNTERLLRESECRNDLIFSANPNAMWVFDTVSLQIIDANQAAVEFYGIPRKMFVGLKMGVLFPDGEGHALLNSLEPRMSARSGKPALEVCKQKKLDGQVVLVELACGHVRWQDQKAVLVSLADVTERYIGDRQLRRENSEMEEELAKVHAELKKSHRDLHAFTYALSNDLLGPLHSANGFATVLIDRYAAVLGDTGKRYINRIQGSIGQLARLVDDLRVLVQLPQAGQMDAVDIAALCNGLIADFRRRNPNRLVMIELNTSRAIVADKVLLTTALNCLLDNAWKFTARKAEGWIRVALMAGTVPGEVVLQVSDNGVGFDAAYTDKLFTAFQRLHSTADFPGNGLGLATVKSVAERHRGRVWAETGVTGASFYMAFPQGNANTPTESLGA